MGSVYSYGAHNIFAAQCRDVLTGPFLASIRHSCLLCQLCLEHCFETVRMRLKVTQSIVEVVQ